MMDRYKGDRKTAGDFHHGLRFRHRSPQRRKNREGPDRTDCDDPHGSVFEQREQEHDRLNRGEQVRQPPRIQMLRLNDRSDLILYPTHPEGRREKPGIGARRPIACQPPHTGEDREDRGPVGNRPSNREDRVH